MAEAPDTPTSFKEGAFDENLEEQNDEVLALQSIYEGGEIERIKIFSSPSENKEGLYTLHLVVPVETSGSSITADILMPARSEVTEAAAATESETPPHVGKRVNFMRSDSGHRWVGSFSVKYLPPLNLQVVMPPTYPSQTAPVFTLSCVWLTSNQLEALCRQLDQIWQEAQNLPIIFMWMDWLENNILSHLAIEDRVLLTQCSDDSDTQDFRAVSDTDDMGQAVATMLQYNRFHTDIDFLKTNHDCHVCYDELPGNQFFRLHDCDHHFCQDCMTSYCEHHVSIGTVENLRCPDTECDSLIPPHIVQAVLPGQDFERWERLLLQKTLESMTDMDWCPRCNNPVIREIEEDLNLGHCTTCFYSFCTECRDPWHQGEMCQSAEDKLMKAENRAPARNEEERRKYEEMKKRMMEEIETAKLMKNRNRKCPKCKTVIEKNGGCNKMTCRCGQGFCWVCIKPIEGYDHFYSGRCSLNENDTRLRLLPPPRETPEAILWMKATLAINPDAKKNIIKCPTCGQENLKENKNNHIRCWGCKSNFCFLCKKKIVGTVTSHFMTGLCVHHS